MRPFFRTITLSGSRLNRGQIMGDDHEGQLQHGPQTEQKAQVVLGYLIESFGTHQTIVHADFQGQAIINVDATTGLGAIPQPVANC